MHNICITWTNITFFFSFLRKVLHLLLEGFIYVKPQIKRFRLHWLYQELRTLAMNIVFYLSILYLQRAAEKKKTCSRHNSPFPSRKPEKTKHSSHDSLLLKDYMIQRLNLATNFFFLAFTYNSRQPRLFLLFPGGFRRTYSSRGSDRHWQSGRAGTSSTGQLEAPGNAHSLEFLP